MSDQEWKVFLQSEGNSDGVEALRKDGCSCVPTIVNGKASFPDMEGDYYTIRNKHCFTPNNPLNTDRRIFIFGPCIVFRAYCNDGQTIEAYLQDLLNKDGYMSWKVLNRGLYSEEICYDQMFMEKLSKDDIVVIIGTVSWLPERLEEEIAFRGDLTEVFVQIPKLADCLLDTVSHCNFIVNEKLAKKLYLDICSTGVLKKSKQQEMPKRIQNYYINWSIHEYFIDYFYQYELSKESGDTKVGAIVMNCNPFTKGHRYLIEQAIEMVDKLYIFIVEEDRSYFNFEDRFRMVEQGVSDLNGVYVIPSGKYIISQETFAQYFEKEQVQTVNSMDYDVFILGEVVAAALGIKYRFVGEEPFDKVTRTYNETMKRILPDYGVAVIKFPRVTFGTNGNQTVSASLVRKALQEEDWKTVDKLCPPKYANVFER